MAKKHTVIIDDTNDGESKELIEKVKSRFDAANQKTFKIIEDFIAGGYEENLARLMIYLPDERRRLALQSLPESVREMLRDGSISAGHARALLTLDSEEAMLTVAEEIIKKDLSVRQTEALCKKPVKVKTEEKPEKQPSFYKMVELALNESLGRKITVTKNKNKEGGILQIEFYSDEELKELSNLLHKEQDND